MGEIGQHLSDKGSLIALGLGDEDTRWNSKADCRLDGLGHMINSDYHKCNLAPQNKLKMQST